MANIIAKYNFIKILISKISKNVLLIWDFSGAMSQETLNAIKMIRKYMDRIMLRITITDDRKEGMQNVIDEVKRT